MRPIIATTYNGKSMQKQLSPGDAVEICVDVPADGIKSGQIGRVSALRDQTVLVRVRGSRDYVEVPIAPADLHFIGR